MSEWIMLAAAILPAAILWLHLEERFAAGTHFFVGQGCLIGNWDMYSCDYT